LGVTGNSRKLYNEELNSLCAPNIICTIESRRYAEHVTVVEENSYSRYVFQLKGEKFNCTINLLHRSAQFRSHYLPNDK